VGSGEEFRVGDAVFEVRVGKGKKGGEGSFM